MCLYTPLVFFAICSLGYPPSWEPKTLYVYSIFYMYISWEPKTLYSICRAPSQVFLFFCPLSYLPGPSSPWRTPLPSFRSLSETPMPMALGPWPSHHSQVRLHTWKQEYWQDRLRFPAHQDVSEFTRTTSAFLSFLSCPDTTPAGYQGILSPVVGFPWNLGGEDGWICSA